MGPPQRFSLSPLHRLVVQAMGPGSPVPPGLQRGSSKCEEYEVFQLYTAGHICIVPIWLKIGVQLELVVVVKL